jgi:hypothetical protein
METNSFNEDRFPKFYKDFFDRYRVEEDHSEANAVHRENRRKKFETNDKR